MAADNSGAATASPAVLCVVSFVEELISDPAAVTPETAWRLRRFLIRVANGSTPAIRLAERFERGEIEGDQLLKMMG